MILVIDAGNTRIKWGWWEDGRWLDKDYAATVDAASLAARLAGRLAGRQADWIGICCVAGEAVARQLASGMANLGPEPYWLTSRAQAHGVRNGYREPGRLGPDRLASLIAAWRGGLAPCVVATAGTAMTVDALTGTGEFLGGLILPGARLMRDSLRLGTAGVAPEAGDVTAFPCCTADAVSSGIQAALAGAVETMAGRLRAREGRDVAVLLGGGDAPWLAPALGGRAQIMEDMVLEGLTWVARDIAVPKAWRCCS